MTEPKKPDFIAIKLVALDGHRMALKSKERIEAIKIMSAHNVSRQGMAWRLLISVQALESFARRHSVSLPPTTQPAHWSREYIDKTYAKEERIKRRIRLREGNSNG